MPKTSEFVSYLLEQLAPLGQLRAKAMFGGFGIYLDQLFIAIVADDVLYVKVDEQNRERFERHALTPFMFSMKNGREGQLSYYPLPESALEDTEELHDWVREGVAAALRAPERKKSKKTKT